MNYIRRGDGQPVILIHGLADTCHDWDSVLEELADAGFSAYAPDLPGHGDSPRAICSANYTTSYLLAALKAWIADLRMTQPFLLVGHSLGGYLCLDFVIKHPQACQKMVLIDPLYTPRQILPILYKVLQRTTLTEKALRAASESMLEGALRLTPLVQAPIPPHLCRQKAQDFKRADPAVMRLPATIKDLSAILNQIQVPTCVIWGERDITLNPTFFPKLVAGLPCATGKALDHTGHQPHVQRPEMVSRLILDFFKEGSTAFTGGRSDPPYQNKGECVGSIC